MFCYIEWFFPAYLLNAFVKTQELAMSKGFDDFVAKPFREAVIFEKMARSRRGSPNRMSLLCN
ncbi:MAG: hypothetical protein EAZ33_14650 [Oscillatoriales cyanobacterium]|nr:MAG: hypothetical protein EAZ33_14650 [Oscillatoriales cyanobacterium]